MSLKGLRVHCEGELNLHRVLLRGVVSGWFTEWRCYSSTVGARKLATSSTVATTALTARPASLTVL